MFGDGASKIVSSVLKSVYLSLRKVKVHTENYSEV